MLQVSQDFRDEVDELHGFLQTLKLGEHRTREQRHPAAVKHRMQLAADDLLGPARLTLGERLFAEERKKLFTAIGEGRTNQEIGRERFAGLDASDLLNEWRDTAHSLAEALGSSAPKRRLPWFGPDMGVQMFTTARYMETWAHGQEVYDLVGASRSQTDRIKNIATIGVKTFGWTFVNRKLEVPGPPPYVRLVAPSGAIWEWNEPSDEEFVRGDAADFCLVVTQGRNIADTPLEVSGSVANQWMSIAQCFAGGPVDPPKPGTRGPQG